MLAVRGTSVRYVSCSLKAPRPCALAPPVAPRRMCRASAPLSCPAVKTPTTSRHRAVRAGLRGSALPPFCGKQRHCRRRVASADAAAWCGIRSALVCARLVLSRRLWAVISSKRRCQGGREGSNAVLQRRCHRGCPTPRQQRRRDGAGPGLGRIGVGLAHRPVAPSPRRHLTQVRRAVAPTPGLARGGQPRVQLAVRAGGVLARPQLRRLLAQLFCCITGKCAWGLLTGAQALAPQDLLPLARAQRCLSPLQIPLPALQLLQLALNYGVGRCHVRSNHQPQSQIWM